MESSRQQGSTTAQQLAALRLHRFSSEGLAMSNLRRRVEGAMSSSLGPPTDTGGIGAATLAWEMATLAQSCAYLAEEAQLWAEKSVDRTLTLADSTYRPLCDSAGTLARLLDAMHRSLRRINEGERPNDICVLNALLGEEIRFMLARGSAITMVECMTNIESQEMRDTGDAGATR